jgi:hypothetical protein
MIIKTNPDAVPPDESPKFIKPMPKVPRIRHNCIHDKKVRSFAKKPFGLGGISECWWAGGDGSGDQKFKKRKIPFRAKG